MKHLDPLDFTSLECNPKCRKRHAGFAGQHEIFKYTTDRDVK
jgi:hypothetical protein